MLQSPLSAPWPWLAGLLLLALSACSSSGSSSPTPAPGYATRLSYSNPPLSGYSLQADPASNGTAHLVLNLVGPAGTVAQGLSFFVSADPAKVAWSKASGSAYATPGTVFNLGSAPQPFLTSLSASGDLQVGIYQKSGSVTLGGAPLVAMAMDLQANAVPVGSTVALAVTPGKQAVYLDATGTVQPLPAAIVIGSLTAN